MLPSLFVYDNVMEPSVWAERNYIQQHRLCMLNRNVLYQFIPHPLDLGENAFFVQGDQRFILALVLVLYNIIRMKADDRKT